MLPQLRTVAIISAFVLLWGVPAMAQSTYTAHSSSADVQDCVQGTTNNNLCSPGGHHTVVNGDIVQIPCTPATWASQLVGPSGVWFTLQFGSGCATPNFGSASSMPSAPCQTGTVITDNSASAMINVTPTYTTNSLMRISCLDIEPFSTSTILANPININGTCTSMGAPDSGLTM